MSTVLCNQGCGTHVQFINAKPFNLDGKTPHSETCLSLMFGKFWGGKYNTIPMAYIKDQLEQSYQQLSAANKSRNIDEILKAVQTAVDALHMISFVMAQQEERNAKWNEDFEEYKTNLVKEQKERKAQQTPHFVRADELQ
jgi:hypothetical protein